MARIFGAIRDGLPRRARRDRMTPLPPGFGCHVANVGVKDDTDDLVVIAADAAGAGRRRVHAQPFVGPSVTISRSTSPTVGRGRSSSCRRTPTSPTARPGAPTPRRSSPPSPTGSAAPPADVLVASTGVIGRRYPIERVLAGVAAVPAPAVRHRRRAGGRRDHDHRHRRQGRRGDGRRRAGPGRRHRQGRRDDRARHGDDDRRAAHRRRRRRRRRSTSGSGGSSTARSTASASTPTPRPATPPSCWPAGRPARSMLDELEAALGGRRRVADQADRPRRRGRRDADRGRSSTAPATPARPSGWPRRSSTRRSSRPPSTAPTPTGGGWRWPSASARTTPTSTRSASSSASATARCTRRSSTTPSSPSCPTTCAATRCASTSRSAPATPTRHGVGLRPHRRLRPHQRRLHDVDPSRPGTSGRGSSHTAVCGAEGLDIGLSCRDPVFG